MFLIISIIFICTIGTLGHFLYDITKHNKVMGLFAAVNESIWEHIKIALTPTILWSLVDGLIYGTNPNYFLAKLLSLITIIILMPTLFSAYEKFIKKDRLIVDVINFYVVITCSQIVFNYVLNIDFINFLMQYVSCTCLFIIFAFYMVLTLMPLKTPLFKDPITNKYGYRGHFHMLKKKKKTSNK